MSSKSKEKTIQKSNLSVTKVAKSFVHAGRGLCIFFKMTHNAWIQSIVFLFVISLSIYFSITQVEWLILIITGSSVLVAEAFNTAIEVDINLTSPTYHPYARDTKDVAAGAVLLTSLTASIVGCIIFIPYVLGVLINK